VTLALGHKVADCPASADPVLVGQAELVEEELELGGTDASVLDHEHGRQDGQEDQLVLGVLGLADQDDDFVQELQPELLELLVRQLHGGGLLALHEYLRVLLALVFHGLADEREAFDVLELGLVVFRIELALSDEFELL